eukprot:TRINITY_DN27642_c0_g1_i1.p1 TRINITY_DN27642_c0_g1~~TRINITY_DN27642_c0_g1_i1.p1  ORF type:complete len:406 (+),score=53.76 TRINITY_DN27642_c0_g1_i1:147-1364(+)
MMDGTPSSATELRHASAVLTDGEEETRRLIAPDRIGAAAATTMDAEDGEQSVLQHRLATASSNDALYRVAKDVDLETGSLEISPPPQRDHEQQRLYKVWPAQNSFFCRGLLITGGSEECWAPNICVWTCILVPCSLYFFWVFPHLWKGGTYALPAATLVVFVVTTGLLLATCCTDPGIIPRREVIIATHCATELEAALGYDVLGGVDGPDPTTPVSVKLQSQGYRWCKTCRIIRPPRASHCADCDNCVLRFDHHCPFVNNCVGQRNYHFFFGFITSVLVLAMLVIPAVLSYFSSLDLETALQGMRQVNDGMRIVFYGLVLFGALVILASVLSLVLWCYHVFLIATNKTTKEFRRSVPNVTEEPTLCASRGPRLFDPWTIINPEDLRRQPTPSRWKKPMSRTRGTR